MDPGPVTTTQDSLKRVFDNVPLEQDGLSYVLPLAACCLPGIPDTPSSDSDFKHLNLNNCSALTLI